MNAQLMTVGESAQELAIRRALGLSAARLRREVLLETVAMTGAGAAVGIGLGLGLAWGLAQVLSALERRGPFRLCLGRWGRGRRLCDCGLGSGLDPGASSIGASAALVLRGE